MSLIGLRQSVLEFEKGFEKFTLRQLEGSVTLGSHVHTEVMIGFRVYCYLESLRHNALEVFNVVNTVRGDEGIINVDP